MKLNCTILFIFVTLILSAQDKLILKDGKVLYVNIVSIHENQVTYTDTTAEAKIYQIPSNELVLLETKAGTLKLIRIKDSITQPTKKYNNAIGIIPSDIALSRFTLAYERILTKKQHVGLMIPFGFNFFNVNTTRASQLSSLQTGQKVNFMWNSGFDLNYYQNTSKNGLFFGPRFRIGYLLYNIPFQAFTVQGQIGKRFCSEDSRLTQHFSVGLGVFKFLEFGPVNYFFTAMSINYRLSVKW
jgi:hypothetical protein